MKLNQFHCFFSKLLFLLSDIRGEREREVKRGEGGRGWIGERRRER